ncbi:aminotransferase class I/II-fold pyridoxal phosphate-dependent enzyme [Vibrio sp. PP-XX7]
MITCTSPSKTFNMAGMQMSNILIQNAAYQATWRQWAGFSTPSPLGIAAVKAAYHQGETWLAALQQYIDGNFAFAVQFIRDKMPKAKFVVPEGTYFIWLDLRDYGLPVQEMNQCLIQQANVLLECGTMSGMQGAGYQRINIACPQAMLAEGLTRMSGRSSRMHWCLVKALVMCQRSTANVVERIFL